MDPPPLFETQNENFKSENGHKVLHFGEPYKYSGANTQTEVTPIPDAVQSVLNMINEQYCESGEPLMNSCLVNCYEGATSHLPKHSDDEFSIHPESTYDYIAFVALFIALSKH